MHCNIILFKVMRPNLNAIASMIVAKLHILPIGVISIFSSEIRSFDIPGSKCLFELALRFARVF